MRDDLGTGSLRQRASAWWLVVGIAWRASPSRSVLALVASIIGQLWSPLLAVAITVLTDGLVDGDRTGALQGVVILLGLSLLSGLVSLLAFPLRMQVRELATHQLDLELVELTASISGIEHFERPEFADRLESLRSMRMILASAFDAVCMNISSAVAIVASVGVLVRLDGMLLLLPLFGVPSVLLSNRSSRRTEEARERLAVHMRLIRKLFDIGVSPVAGKELRVFGADDAIEARHAEESLAFERSWDRVALRNGLEGVLGRLAFALGFGAAIALLIRSAATGSASVGEVAGAVTLAATVQGQVQMMVQMAAWARQCAESARRYQWLVEHADEVGAEERSVAVGSVPERIDDAVVLDDVGFRYPGTEVDVLVGVRASIPAGSIVAVVGDNGAGKSTLVKLLARMYRPTAGRILVDGVDLETVPVAGWRGLLSGGFQDFARFELPVVSSVGLGDLPRVDDEDASRAALDRAASIDVLDGLPAGLHTQLGKEFADGHELSGGQWQKVALGRAMMRDEPLVLLLDEPTAALDAEVEHALFDRYSVAARAAGARTGAITVLVSHRFSTVRAADVILVVSGNRVAEQGSHAELMARGGIYAELFELQASSYR